MCINILRETSAYPIAFRELAKTANERKEQIKSYIGDDLNIETNRKLRAIYDELLINEHITLVQQKPSVFQWKSKQDGSNNDDNNEQEQTMVKADKQASDISDLSDTPRSVAATENENEGQQQQEVPPTTMSDMSDMSDSIYEPLIEREHLSNVNRIAYRCKEHPDITFYDIKGIEESHFKPFHK
jgi:hypothetical protein